MARMLGYTVEAMHTPLHTFVYQETQADLARRLAERQQGRGQRYDAVTARRRHTAVGLNQLNPDC